MSETSASVAASDVALGSLKGRAEPMEHRKYTLFAPEVSMRVSTLGNCRFVGAKSDAAIACFQAKCSVWEVEQKTEICTNVSRAVSEKNSLKRSQWSYTDGFSDPMKKGDRVLVFSAGGSYKAAVDSVYISCKDTVYYRCTYDSIGGNPTVDTNFYHYSLLAKFDERTDVDLSGMQLKGALFDMVQNGEPGECVQVFSKEHIIENIDHVHQTVTVICVETHEVKDVCFDDIQEFRGKVAKKRKGTVQPDSRGIDSDVGTGSVSVAESILPEDNMVAELAQAAIWKWGCNSCGSIAAFRKSKQEAVRATKRGDKKQTEYTVNADQLRFICASCSSSVGSRIAGSLYANIDNQFKNVREEVSGIRGIIDKRTSNEVKFLHSCSSSIHVLASSLDSVKMRSKASSKETDDIRKRMEEKQSFIEQRLDVLERNISKLMRHFDLDPEPMPIRPTGATLSFGGSPFGANDDHRDATGYQSPPSGVEPIEDSIDGYINELRPGCGLEKQHFEYFEDEEWKVHGSHLLNKGTVCSTVGNLHELEDEYELDFSKLHSGDWGVYVCGSKQTFLFPIRREEPPNILVDFEVDEDRCRDPGYIDVKLCSIAIQLFKSVLSDYPSEWKPLRFAKRVTLSGSTFADLKLANSEPISSIIEQLMSKFCAATEVHFVSSMKCALEKAQQLLRNKRKRCTASSRTSQFSDSSPTPSPVRRASVRKSSSESEDSSSDDESGTGSHADCVEGLGMLPEQSTFSRKDLLENLPFVADFLAEPNKASDQLPLFYYLRLLDFRGLLHQWLKNNTSVNPLDVPKPQE